MDKKKLLFIIGIIIIVILGVIAINISKKKTSDEEIDTLNKDLLKDMTISNLNITDQSLITRDGMSTYMANVTSTSQDTYHIDKLYVVFTEGDNEIKALGASEIDLNNGQTIPINISFDSDISKITKIEYKIEKNEEVAD